jgi:hypothetical protein
MKTVDFLPPKAFTDHLERRRTPRRLMILGVFCGLCLGAATAVEVEANSQETKALIAETPDDRAQQATVELKNLLAEIAQEALRLDPLTEHIQMPTLGEVLAGLANAVGRGTEIEKVNFSHEIKQDGRGGKVKCSVEMVVTCKVRGDENLLALPGRLQQLTGYAEAKASRVELVKNRNDLIRVDVTLTNPLNVPQALVNRNSSSKRKR